MIQQLSKQQLSTVRDLAYAIWPICYAAILSQDQIDYMLDRFYSIQNLEDLHQSNHHFIALYEGGEPLGFASFEHGLEGSTTTKLHKIYVLTNQHTRGLGQQLMDAVIDAAVAAGATQLQLNVNRYNKALGFYEKNNFSIVKTEDIAIGNGYLMEDYVMVKHL